MKIINKKLLAFLLAALMCLSAGVFPSAATETLDVIIMLDEVSADTFCQKAQNNLSHFEVKHIYSSAINGVAASVASSDIKRLEAMDGVAFVSDCIKYNMAKHTEKEIKYNMIYADENMSLIPKSAGEGSVIAVIDSGFNLRHAMLMPEKGFEGRLDLRTLSDIIGFTNASKKMGYAHLEKYTYVNSKIPFAFDYYDGDTNVLTKNNHGTAMAGVAAGKYVENGIFASGAAPSAQLLAMKVFDDNGYNASTEAVIAALEDAYLLGADVVSMSLGSPCGFSEEGRYDPALEAAIKALVDNGIFVVCSAGNFASLGDGSIYDEYYGYNEPLSAYPDSGTVSAPSTIKEVLSVAGADTYSGRYPAIKLAESEKYIPYTDSNSSYTIAGSDKYRQPFNITFDTQTLEYVSIPGLGKIEDFEEIAPAGTASPLYGKIALIQRGEITFIEKVQNAEKYGAAAVIIYDNTDEQNSLRTKMDLTGTNIPAILVSKADGEAMLNAQDKRFSVSKNDIYVTNAGVYPAMSEFSSTGPTPTLFLKPEITAAGEKMMVAAADGGYVEMSGTSISSAYVAGVAASIMGKLENACGAQKVQKAKNILMGGAKPIRKSSEDGGFDYVRAAYQGAGLVSPEAASTASLILTSNGQAGISLGNKLPDKFDISLTIENISDGEQSVSISALIGCPDVEEVKYSELCSEKDGFFKEKGVHLYEYLGKSANDSVYFTQNTINPFESAEITIEEAQINMVSEDFENKKITLAPHSQITVDISVDISKRDKEYMARVFENGSFIEGFVFVKADKEYSLPMLGFDGDFYSVNPFGENMYENASIFGGVYLYSDVDNDLYNGQIFLGTNNIQNGKSAYAKLDEKLCAVSPEASDGGVYLSMAPTRNIVDFKAEVVSASGDTLSSVLQREILTKAYAEGDVPASLKKIIWDCRSTENDKYVYPDGIYTCKLSGYDALGNHYSEDIDFLIDTQKPELVSHTVINKDGNKILKLALSDNHYIQNVALEDDNGNEAEIDESLFSHDSLVKKSHGEVTELEADITLLDGSFLYVTITDLAFNTSIIRIEI